MLRIRRLDTPIRSREFRFLENPSTAMLLSQLRTFDGQTAVGKHDDLIDALDMAQQMPRHLNQYYGDLRKAK